MWNYDFYEELIEDYLLGCFCRIAKQDLIFSTGLIMLNLSSVFLFILVLLFKSIELILRFNYFSFLFLLELRRSFKGTHFLNSSYLFQ